MKLLLDIQHWAVAAVVASISFCVFVVAVFSFAAATKRTLKAILSRTSRCAGLLLLAAAASAIIYGGSKQSLLPRSNADNGINLSAVAAWNTNGVSHVAALATGASPAPMWYRPSVSNEWTLATDDGWTLAASQYLPEPGKFSNEWTRAESDFSPVAMYWFGDNPPAVEVVVEGGLDMVSFRASGLGVEVDWSIDEAVSLADGSRVVLEIRSGQQWIEVAAVEPHDSRAGTISVDGWFLGFSTRWRLKLEVPR